MAFEVASVKSSKVFKPANLPMQYGNEKTPGGRFSASFPFVIYLEFAYKLWPFEISEASLAQLPKSVGEDFFEIEARGEGNPTKDQLRLMMQSLLAERFKLAVRFENREGPVLALTLVRPGQTGPKLRPHADTPPCPGPLEVVPTFAPASPENASEVFPLVCDAAQTRETPKGTQLASRSTTMALVAEDIYNYGGMAGEVDKLVVDRTGLTGRFDFSVELPSSFFFSRPVVSNPSDVAPEPRGTRFLNAVRDQLGLKVERSRGPVRTIVIDHVEAPSEN
jgi:uncharacterized protein (TIGR03435 family)